MTAAHRVGGSKVSAVGARTARVVPHFFTQNPQNYFFCARSIERLRLAHVSYLEFSTMIRHGTYLAPQICGADRGGVQDADLRLEAVTRGLGGQKLHAFRERIPAWVALRDFFSVNEVFDLSGDLPSAKHQCYQRFLSSRLFCSSIIFPARRRAGRQWKFPRPNRCCANLRRLRHLADPQKKSKHGTPGRGAPIGAGSKKVDEL